MLDKVKFIGRWINKNGKPYCSFSGCGFEFEVKPLKQQFSVNISLVSQLREHNEQFVSIYVDDVFYSKEKLLEGENNVDIVLKKNKITRIRIVKINEVYLSSLYLNNINLDGCEFQKIKENDKKRIGFFGDSITCGYGVLGYHEPAFSMASEDFTKSYAYLTSFKLNLDYFVVARSGISIAIPVYCEKLFEEIYDTVDMEEKSPKNDYLDYAFINLGTNDNGGLNQVDKDTFIKVFKQKYIKLITRIISDNPGVKVIMGYNCLAINQIVIECIKDVFENAKATFKNKLVLVEFVPNSDGANGHPYKDAHEQFANKLVDVIKTL